MYIYLLLRIYLSIYYIHGIYVAYSFMKYIIIHLYNGSYWILSYFDHRNDQIQDKNYEISEYKDYLIISYKISST